MPYITKETLLIALHDLRGTADHLLKIWFALKQMGMEDGNPVLIDTSSSHDALVRLFAFGSPSGDLLIPFAHTERFLTMKADASRSIIQTNLNRWAVSGSVVTVDPTSYLDISQQANGSLNVQPGRGYPMGLGYGKNGFALENDARVSIPLVAFGLWYYRQSNIENTTRLSTYFQTALRGDLHLTLAEQELIFVTDSAETVFTFQDTPLTDSQVFQAVQESLGVATRETKIVRESYPEYTTKVNSMITSIQGPQWLNYVPEAQLRALIDNGSKAILLYGPPRTGKTRAVDNLYPRSSANRETIQIHSGWGYDELIIGLKPDHLGTWSYQLGPLLSAIRSGKSPIVLEEINRTEFSQAIGEVFSLIESAYRGSKYQIRLRNGEYLYIPAETVIICTINTLDRSTEELDDALLGRMDAVEFPPRVEDLQTMFVENDIPDSESRRMREFFGFVQQYYPLGHGYFADFKSNFGFVPYYLSKIRPLLQKHMKNYRDQELEVIDTKVDELFGK